LCFSAAEPLQAGQHAYGLEYTAEHSDNISRVSTDERSDLINSLSTGFVYQESSIDLVAHVLAKATYNTYQKNSFADETLFDLNSSAVWMISPQRFLWTLEDRYQQSLLDSTLADTPANRTNVNVLSTGPDVYLRLAPVHTLAFGARAGYVYTGKANADNKRFNGTAGWLYMPSSITTLSLNYELLDVRYDDSVLNDDYTNENIFVRADFHPSRSQYVLDLGVTNISFDRGNDANGTLARLSWIRQSTPESSFGASFSKVFSDTGSDTLATTTLGSQGSASTQASVVTGDVYSTKGGNIFYSHRGSKIGLYFQAEKRKLDFETTPQDRKETIGRLQVRYFFVGATTATLFTEYDRTEYISFVQRDTEQNTGIRLDYQINRAVSLGLEGRHLDRSSTVPSSNFVDNRVLFTILYSSAPLYTQLRNLPQLTPLPSR